MRFFRGWPESPIPFKAPASLTGEVPARALQHCEPFLEINRSGFLLYPPISFSLYSDGSSIFVNFTDDNWIILDKISLPNFNELWKKNVPENLYSAMPIFLESFPERGVVQIWTGYFMETPKGVSSWIRSPINRIHSNAYRIIEGLVETDWWRGPIFTNVEILRTDFPISFSTDTPFLQIIPWFRLPEESRESVVLDYSEMNDDFFESINKTTIRRNTEKPGSYRRMSKKNRNEKKNG